MIFVDLKEDKLPKKRKNLYTIEEEDMVVKLIVNKISIAQL